MSIDPNELRQVLRETRVRPRDSAESNEAWSALHRFIRIGLMVQVREPLPAGIDLDDVAQDLALRLTNPVLLNDIEHSTNPVAYLHILGKRMIADLVRKDRRRRLIVEASSEELAPQPITVRSLDSMAAAATVRAAFDQLDRSDQELLRMRFWQELSTNEIAAALGISYANAAVRIHRALKQLGELLEPSKP